MSTNDDDDDDDDDDNVHYLIGYFAERRADVQHSVFYSRFTHVLRN